MKNHPNWCSIPFSKFCMTLQHCSSLKYDWKWSPAYIVHFFLFASFLYTVVYWRQHLLHKIAHNSLSLGLTCLWNHPIRNRFQVLVLSKLAELKGEKELYRQSLQHFYTLKYGSSSYSPCEADPELKIWDHYEGQKGNKMVAIACIYSQWQGWSVMVTSSEGQ